MSERPPTPTGWSDTDWIKKLQYDEENPLACLHINQGSFDAAADAYEEEYKMSKRTAMDIADALEVEMPTPKNTDDAAEMLRSPAAEIERLTALNSALTAKANALVISNARLDEKIDSLTAERDTAIASAVAAEREACAVVCEKSSFPAFTARCFAADIRARSVT